MQKTLNSYRPSLDEISDVISKLNMDVISTELYEHPHQIIMSTNGDVINISFLDNVLWSTEDDDRIYFEINDTYEDFSKFLLKKLYTIIEEYSNMFVSINPKHTIKNA